MAIFSFRKLFNNPGDILSGADAARDRAEWTAAAEQYGKYLSLKPDDDRIWVQLGHAKKEAGDVSGALSAYLRALSIAPGAADTHLMLGHLRKTMGDLEQAAAHYADAVAQDPEALDPLVQLAFAEKDLGHDAAALTHFREIQRRDPDNREAADLAQALAGSTHKFQQIRQGEDRDRDVSVNFCPVCNSTAFLAVGDQENAQCATCGSMERHRLFALFLLAQDLTPNTKLCVITKGPQPSGYLERLSGYVNMDISKPDDFSGFISRNPDKYDIVYHDYLADSEHQASNFFREIVSNANNVINPGGVNVLSLGKSPLTDFFSETVFDFCQDKENYTRNSKFKSGIAYRYTPIFTYGDNILDACNLRVSYGRLIGCDDLIVRRKAQA